MASVLSPEDVPDDEVGVPDEVGVGPLDETDDVVVVVESAFVLTGPREPERRNETKDVRIHQIVKQHQLVVRGWGNLHRVLAIRYRVIGINHLVVLVI